MWHRATYDGRNLKKTAGSILSNSTHDFLKFGSCLLIFFCTEVMVIAVGKVVPHTRFHQNHVLVEVLCAGLCLSYISRRCSGAPDNVPMF